MSRWEMSGKDFIKSAKRQDNHVLITTEDSNLSIHRADDLSHVLTYHFEQAYDSILVDSHLLVVSQRSHPICLYHLVDNKLISLSRLGEFKPNSETFYSPLQLIQQSEQLIGCGKGFVRAWNIETLALKSQLKIKKDDVISCLATPHPLSDNRSQTQNLIAIGSYDKSVRLCSLKDGKEITQMKVHIGGVTQVMFSPLDSLHLYSAARQDNFVYEWDLRNTSKFIGYIERSNCTNQRVSFDTNGKEFLLGNDDGTACLYSQNQSPKIINIHEEAVCVNSSVMLDGGYLFAYGERTFTEKPQPSGLLFVQQ